MKRYTESEINDMVDYIAKPFDFIIMRAVKWRAKKFLTKLNDKEQENVYQKQERYNQPR